MKMVLLLASLACLAGCTTLPVPHAQSLPGGNDTTHVLAVWLDKGPDKVNYTFSAGALNRTLSSDSPVNQTSVRLNAAALSPTARVNPDTVVYAGTAFYQRDGKTLVDVDAKNTEGRSLVTFTASADGDIVGLGYPK